ncbi:MAG TPA: chemotaxis protein CheB, partial [Tepidisphaeraceae bacterium]|nr:chemotaxis protein CheB [Tepidisphaeraceae bacterium]
ASAGGVQVLQELMQGLPEDFPGAVFVVVHTAASSPGVLPQILGRAGPLPAAHAEDGEKIRMGRIYVAPPDFHLLIRDGEVGVTRGPKENGFRPAVDVLFRTAARTHGARVVGIVLTGGLDDGTVGLTHIKSEGGIAVAQEPSEAGVPEHAAKRGGERQDGLCSAGGGDAGFTLSAGDRASAERSDHGAQREWEAGRGRGGERHFAGAAGTWAADSFHLSGVWRGAVGAQGR